MDTVLNLGLNDKTVEALAEMSGDRRFAYDSYRRFITMYSDVVLGFEHSSLRGHPRYLQGQPGLYARHRSHRRRLGRSGRPLQGRGGARNRQGFPAGSARPVVGRDRRGVFILDERARGDLPAAARHSGILGHRGQRAGDGVRQHGRDLGDRRCVHAQSLDRREQAVRRIPDQRAGRGRGGGHPHAAGHHRICAQGIRLRQGLDGNRDARGVQGTDADLHAARKALPRHAGHGVHGRAGQAVDAADPRRQAHREGGAAHRRRTRQ